MILIGQFLVICDCSAPNDFDWSALRPIILIRSLIIDHASRVTNKRMTYVQTP